MKSREQVNETLKRPCAPRNKVAGECGGARELVGSTRSANPAPPCQPPYKDGGVLNEDATKYPVTVFLEHFDSYLSDGKAEYERFKAEKASGGERSKS